MNQNNFFITQDDKIERLDKLLAKKFKTKSRSYFQYLIENGSVLVNNQKVKKRFIFKVGDEIDVFFQALPDISIEAEDIPLDILYEDDHLIAINKPANMVVHPANGNWSKTFVNALLYYLKNQIEFDDQIRPGIVHRLDKDTTGILLAAKTIASHQNLIEQFKQRKIKKTYLAITINKPENQTVVAPIARHPIKRKEMAIIQKGKDAITKIEVLKYNDKLALVLAKPKTGRTHQIRVHLKHIGCPILGDPIYGNKTINNKYNLVSLLLHAHLLEFYHPITNKKITISAKIPKNFQKIIDQIL